MSKSLSILYVTSEVYPFVKVGSIGDISYSFSLAVRDFGHDIRVMLPKYGNISERKNKIHEINRLKDIAIPIGKDFDPATVKSSSIANPRVKVQIYITTNNRFFDQIKAIYTDPVTGIDVPNNDERFIYFNKTVVETCMLLGWVPDIIHCNDWQTALIPAYVKQMFPDKFRKTKVIFTIHNFSRQGIFPSATFDKTGFGKDIKKNFIYKNNFNFMKSALYYADYITTDSEEYANEILKDTKYSDGLNKMLIERTEKFAGISMAYDNYQWNPKNDPDLHKKFTDKIEPFKTANKKELVKLSGLEYHQNIPLIGMVSKINAHKGIPQFIEQAENILKEDLQIVFLGEGNHELMNKLKKIAKNHPNNFFYKPDTDDSFAHLIMAGADMALLPAIYSPNGLTGLYALNYGTVPIANLTGSLKEFLIPYKADTKSGNSYVFNFDDPVNMLKSIKEAMEEFKNKDNWLALAKNCMNNGVNWEKSVKKYDDIYKLVLKDEK